jgi:hypothetical protein
MLFLQGAFNDRLLGTAVGGETKVLLKKLVVGLHVYSGTKAHRCRGIKAKRLKALRHSGTKPSIL